MTSLHRLRPLSLAVSLGLVAATQPAAAAGVTAQADPAAYQLLGSSTKKSLVIGIDGAAFAKFASTSLPAIRGVQSRGLTALSNLYAQPMAPTMSGPGWSSIATGTWPDKHGVVDNSFSGARFSQYPDYLTRLETASSSLETLVVGTWGPIATTVFGSSVDQRISGGSDANTTAVAADRLRNGDPDATFVHLDDVDHAGHAHGADSPEYLQALRDADARVATLLAAVDARPTRAQEDWLIVLTADHGHTPSGGHGGSSPQERQTFVIAQGPGIAAGSTRHDIKVVDIAPSVLAHTGVARSASWGLDGAALGDVTPDAFDSLRPVLRERVDETGIPAGVLGWTTTAPNGWTIDNSRMPTGGVTEWRGWSFATDEFWTGAQLGQGRETSVRNRNVFAVADSDEWDDIAHPAGQFDSTLTSPALPVEGRSAVLTYATTYRVDGPQTGDVYVSFDGGAAKLVKSYRSDINLVERVALKVPAGARTVKVSFRYTGTNSYFWTVDQVRVEP